MVPCALQIITKNKTFPLNQNFTYTNYGIYVAPCVICYGVYVGQTINKYSTIWSLHHSKWNKPDCKDDKDQTTLLQHCSVFHFVLNKPPIVYMELMLLLYRTTQFSLPECSFQLDA